MHILRHNTIRKLNLLALTAIFYAAITGSGFEGLARIRTITSLDVNTGSMLKDLRDDVHRSLYTVKSTRPLKEMPPLKFYKYTVKKNDSFWLILSKTNLDLDTIVSVNNLSSPGQIREGLTLYLPNMRGIITSGLDSKSLTEILKRERVDAAYIRQVNRITSLVNRPLFIPCGKLSETEKSFFLGTGFISPVDGRKTSGFGTRNDPFGSRRHEFHRGIDVSCPVGTEIKASCGGTVTFSGYKGGYGKLIVVRHARGYESLYGHLSRFTVRPGQKVERGQLIGYSGNTGHSTGPHLHFEVRKNSRAVNPESLMR